MNPQTEIYRHTSAHHDITITDYGFLRVLSFGCNRQSSMYLDAPFDTDFEYPGYFHIALAMKPDATRTLAIGLGGATVVKRMWRDYPEMRIDAVELDPDVVDVARRFFSLPEDPRIRVFVDDGRRFLESSVDSYDIVIIDAFDDDLIPPSLTGPEFMLALRERLAPDGVVAYNFMGSVDGEGNEPFRSLYRTLSNTWKQVFVFVINEGVESDATNISLLATDAELTADQLLSRIADRVGGRVTVPAFHLFGDDLYVPRIPPVRPALTWSRRARILTDCQSLSRSHQLGASLTAARVADKTARRAELVSAAAAAFADRGVANTSVSDIVRAAGVAQGTFYLYFASKDDAVLAVVGQLVDGIVSAIEIAAKQSGATAVESLLGLRDALSSIEADPTALELADFIHRAENRALHDRLAEQLTPRLVPLVEAIIAQGVDEDAFDVPDIRAAAWFVLGGLQSAELAGTPASELPAALAAATQLALRALGYQEAAS